MPDSCSIQEEKPHLRRCSTLARKNLSRDFKSEAGAVIMQCCIARSEEEVRLLISSMVSSMASQVYQKYSTTTTSKQRVTKDMQDVLVLSTRLDTHARRRFSCKTSWFSHISQHVSRKTTVK